MKARRVIIIEEMFRDICTHKEMQIINELYRKNNKGSAVVFMLKRIRKKWNELLGKASFSYSNNSSFLELSEPNEPKIVKFKYKGVTTYETL